VLVAWARGLSLSDEADRCDVLSLTVTIRNAQLTRKIAMPNESLTDNERRLDELTESALREVEQFKDLVLKTHYCLWGSPFFSVLLRRPHILSMEELCEILDTALDEDALSSTEATEIRRADLVVRVWQITDAEVTPPDA
jgi:hypothetical protein